MGRIAGRALVYAQAAAVVILLATGRARAELNLEGQDPILALLESFSQNGIPVPREVEDAIRSDPELQAIVEEAARSGDMTAAQEAASERAMEILAEHIDEFTDEELRTLLTSSEMIAGQDPVLEPTLEQLRAAARSRGIPTTGGEPAEAGGGEGVTPPEGDQAGGLEGGTETEGTTEEQEGVEGGESEQDGGSGGDTDGGRTTEEEIPGISEAQRDALDQAPENVRQLWRRMTGSGEGPQVTDEVVQRFLATFGEGLTEEELQRLIQELGPVQGQSADEILERLEQRLAEIRAGETEVASGESETVPPTDESEGESIPPDELWARMREVIAQVRARESWPAEGSALIEPSGGRFPANGESGTGTFTQVQDGTRCMANVAYTVRGRDTTGGGQRRIRFTWRITSLVGCVDPNSDAPCPLDSETRPPADRFPPRPWSCNVGSPVSGSSTDWWNETGEEND